MTEDQHCNLEDVWKFLAPKHICPYEKDWHLSYGLTENRAMALFGPPENSGSLRNPNSETALTIFLLGHLNKWTQPKRISDKKLPRTKNNRLNGSFFQELCGCKGSDENKENNKTFLEHIVVDSDSDPKSRLLFEIGVPNIAFRTKDKKPIKSSFINETSDAWSQFDAMLLVPEEKRVIGIEAKLSSDISIGTTNHPYVNQIIRNLEAGYWLTNCDGSLFSGWTFEYVFICPKNAMEYKATHYSHILTDKKNPCVKTALDNYEDYLKEKKPKYEKNDFKCFRDHFTDNKRITVSYWCDLTKLLSDRDKEPIQLPDEDSVFREPSRDRFKLACIPDCHYF